MEQWEYRFVSFRPADVYPSYPFGEFIGSWQDGVEQKSAKGTVNDFLNVFGGDGWELVSFAVSDTPAAVFKRRKS